MFGGPACCPVRVQTSCAEICSRAAGVAAAAAPPRLTVAVVPSTATSIVVPRGNAVMAGGVGLASLCSQGVCGFFRSAPTRLVTRFAGEVPVGTNTESGTSTWPVES